MKIQDAQLTVVLTTEFCVTNIVKNMHRYLTFIFLVFSVAMGVSSVAASYHQGSVYVLFMSPVDVLWMFVYKPQYEFLFSAC